MNYSVKFLADFKPDLDFYSKERYFKSDSDLKMFIEYCNKNMIPIIANWWSNLNGWAMRRKNYDLIHIKNKCDKANVKYNEYTTRKQESSCVYSEIKINTLEQLKILEGVLEDIEAKYFMVWNNSKYLAYKIKNVLILQNCQNM